MAQNENPISEAAQDEILASILQKISPPAQQASNQGSSSGGDILSSLLSNPELISKLPAILSGVKPILELFGTTGTVSAPVSSAPAEPVSAITPQKDTAAAFVKQSSRADSRTALLCAMKPYLSPKRREKLERAMKLARMIHMAEIAFGASGGDHAKI